MESPLLPSPKLTKSDPPSPFPISPTIQRLSSLIKLPSSPTKSHRLPLSFIDSNKAPLLHRHAQANPSPSSPKISSPKLKKSTHAPSFDPATQAFLDNISSKTSSVLHIGATSPLPLLHALENNKNLSYHITQVAPRFLATKPQLDPLHSNQLDTSSLEESSLAHLTIHPFTLHNLSKNTLQSISLDSYDAILAPHCLEFLSIKEFLNALNFFHLILKPKGKIFILALSPYNKLALPFLPIFENNLKNQHINPGYCTSLQDYHEEPIALGSYFFLDTYTLQKYFECAGFSITTCQYTPINPTFTNYLHQNQECTLLIAQKN